MSDENALIAGIRGNPLDDLRRLVYADWLDERGRSTEAEYLRLVAALAEPGTPVDLNNPHAVRLLELADRLDHIWREGVGSRFDLWFDGYDLSQKINFIKAAREVSGLGLAEIADFCHSLPKVLNTGLPYEEAVGQVKAFHQSAPQYRIVPSTEKSSHGLLRGDVALTWQAGYHDGVRVSSSEQTRAALGHLRRILLTDVEAAWTSPRIVDSV